MDRVFIFQGDDSRLDRAIQREFSESLKLSRSQIERIIESGGVFVNGRSILKAAYKIAHGDSVEIRVVADERPDFEPFRFKLDLLFEDSHLIVINKPAGLSMHPGAGNRSKTLANAVVAHVGERQSGVGERDRPGIVHRLDKDTTGVVVVAKSSRVLTALALQFAERTIEREYKALVFTTPRARRAVQLSDSGEISSPIGRHPTQRTKMAISERGRAAITEWRVLERYDYGSLLGCRLKTGRTHQIRVHLNSIGSPIIGDPVYGDFSNLPRPLREASEGFGRQALHAATLSFTHPISNRRLSFSAELPADFCALIKLFRGQVVSE
jgi:23S rRNA pseudouridine1911/1915/1917 synthase